MTFDLSTKKDQNKIDTVLDHILNAHASSDVNQAQARYLLGHLIIAAAGDNEAEVRGWLDDPQRIINWLEEAKKLKP